MKKIVYGSLSVLTAVCTVFVAARAEVFSENRTDAANSEVVESNEVDGLFGTSDGLGSLGTPLEGSQSINQSNLGLSLDKSLTDADNKALNGFSNKGSALLDGQAVKAMPSQGKLAKQQPASAAMGTSAFSTAPAPATQFGSQIGSQIGSQTSSQDVDSTVTTGSQNRDLTDRVYASPASSGSTLASPVRESRIPYGPVVSQATPDITPAVPAGSTALPSSGASPSISPSASPSTTPSDPTPLGVTPSSTGLEAAPDEMNLDAEPETVEPESANSPTATPVPTVPEASTMPGMSGPESTDTESSDTESTDTESTGAEAPETMPAPAIGDPGLESESSADEPGTALEDITAPAESSPDALEAGDEGGTAEDLMAPAEDSVGAPSGTTTAPAGTSAPGLGETSAPSEGVMDDAMSAPGSTTPELGQPAIEEDVDLTPEAGTGVEAEGMETDTQMDPSLSPEADVEEDADIEEDAGIEETVPGGPINSSPLPDESSPAIPSTPSAPLPSAPGTLSPAAPSTPLPSAPSTPLPSTPGTLSPATPLPEGPSGNTIEPLSPIEEDVVPGDMPTSEVESFGESDRLVGAGFSPFQLSYLAINGGLEGIPGGDMLLSAYESGDLSAADIVDAGASTNRLGTDAENQDDYTAGVARFLNLLSRDSE